jgi:leucyl-tRNA synthetase
MADYSKEEIKRIEGKWREEWEKRGVYKVENQSGKPKYYVLDMFPYPSGAGLHVGHPLGYIASDIVSRYKRLKGFNVLHPMGFDAFGLPAEQYAIQTGQHPKVTTEENIATYVEQLQKIGFSFDWSRRVVTSDPAYYKWTQWIFGQLFNSWYNNRATDSGKSSTDGSAEPIVTLIQELEKNGNENINASCNESTPIITADQWDKFDEKSKENFLQNYRIAYLAETMVNWCAALGTVLSNDEVKDGVSERGGYPVERIKMMQWNMRITAYAERLLKGLDTVDWPDPVSEMQRNWIGKSVGCELDFAIESSSLTPALSKGEGDHGFKTSEAKYWNILKEFGRENRKNPTEAESTLWQQVRGNKLGHKIRRQHAIGIFIGDFVCLDKRLVIEVDGEYHLKNQEFDAARTAFLKSEGFSVIRFSNHDVKHSLQKVLREIKYALDNAPTITTAVQIQAQSLRVFTTRIDTIFGVTFMVIAPEHELVGKITTIDRRNEVMEYVEVAKNRSERERMSEVKRISGVFTGAYALHPFNNAKIPIWVADYVLAGYGTGAVMAVPSSDIRDYAFAKHFDLPIIDVLEGPTSYITNENFNPKSGTMINSDFLNGLPWDKAIGVALQNVEDKEIGIRKVNYRMRDAIFGRQRYWGEPFPVYYKDGIPKLVDDKDLPVTLPSIDEFRPTETGEPPLARAKDWLYRPKTSRDRSQVPLSSGEGGGEAYPFELTTMPGWAGSSWYWFRYMDPTNDNDFCKKEIQLYWKEVDLYIGGSEHATGHLLYSRFWCKALKDLGHVYIDEPFKKLINQGHIQGISKFAYRLKLIPSLNREIFISHDIVQALIEQKDFEELGSLLVIHGVSAATSKIENAVYIPIHVDINIVINDILDIEKFIKWRPELEEAIFIKNSKGVFICASEVEKMSKSKFNVVNPDDIIENYGADTLRMYEMFLGPLEISKPWNTNGIDGVFKFLRRVWNLFHTAAGEFLVTDEQPTAAELKALHKALKKVEYDIDHYSFNTTVSEFMICSNELTSLKCNKRTILEPLIIALSPYAPHIAEELWEKLGHADSILNASFPQYREEHLVESSFEYPISINGKVRAKMNFALDMPKADVEKMVLASDVVQKWTDGKVPKKVIVVPGRIVNVVV